MSTASYSAENLERFLVMAGEKGLMNKNTASSIRNTTSKVLAVLEDHERIDMRSIDRDRVFHRFQNLHGMKYSPESLATYRSRFATALDEFIGYTKDPSAYKHQGRNSSVAKKRVLRVVRPPAKASAPQLPSEVTAVTSTPVLPEALMIPIPIRDGQLLRIFGVPPDLTEEEAKKICAVVQAYSTASKA